MDVSTPPSLDLACPQAKTKIDNHDNMFRERGVDKTKYGQESIMINTITTIYYHKTSHEQVIIHYNIKV